MALAGWAAGTRLRGRSGRDWPTSEDNVHRDVTVLLDVQQDDRRSSARGTTRALAPRIAALAADTRRADEGRAAAQTALDAEEKRQRDIQFESRSIASCQGNETVLTRSRPPRRRPAAVAQAEQARRMVADASARSRR